MVCGEGWRREGLLKTTVVTSLVLLEFLFFVLGSSIYKKTTVRGAQIRKIWYGKKGLWHPMTRDIFSAFFWLLILRLGLANGNPWYPWCWHVVVECCDGLTLMFFPGKILGPPGDLDNFDGTETNNFWTPKGFICIVLLDFQLNGLTKNTFSDMFRNYAWRKLVSPVCVCVFPREPPPFFPFSPMTSLSTTSPVFFRGFASKVFTGLGCLERGYNPWKINMVHLKRSPWKRWFLLETIIFRFHVKFRGSMMILEGTVVDSEIRQAPVERKVVFSHQNTRLYSYRWLAALSINSILLSPRKLTYPPEKMMLERRLFLPFWNGASSTFVCFSGMYWFEVRPKPSASGNLFLHLHFQRLGKKWQTWKPEKWYLCFFFLCGEHWSLQVDGEWIVTFFPKASEWPLPVTSSSLSLVGCYVSFKESAHVEKSWRVKWKVSDFSAWINSHQLNLIDITPPRKLTWQWNVQDFEDVFPIENGGIFQCHVRFRRCTCSLLDFAWAPLKEAQLTLISKDWIWRRPPWWLRSEWMCSRPNLKQKKAWVSHHGKTCLSINKTGHTHVNCSILRTLLRCRCPGWSIGVWRMKWISQLGRFSWITREKKTKTLRHDHRPSRWPFRSCTLAELGGLEPGGLGPWNRGAPN